LPGSGSVPALICGFVAEPGLGADDPARTSLAGALRERIDDAALDRFDAALAANRRERIAAVEPA